MRYFFSLWTLLTLTTHSGTCFLLDKCNIYLDKKSKKFNFLRCIKKNMINMFVVVVVKSFRRWKTIRTENEYKFCSPSLAMMTSPCTRNIHKRDISVWLLFYVPLLNVSLLLWRHEEEVKELTIIQSNNYQNCASRT